MLPARCLNVILNLVDSAENICYIDNKRDDDTVCCGQKRTLDKKRLQLQPSVFIFFLG